MSYGETKVYHDGSHYIAIPHTTRPNLKKKKKNLTEEEMKVKETADKVFKESKSTRKKEKIENLENELKEVIKDEEKRKEYIETYMDRKKRNLIERRKRLSRKINLGQWNYFCTFTYDDKKLTEENFIEKLKDSLKKLSSRKNWVYILVLEHSPEKERAHFHGIFHIPDGAMVGELIEVNDYSFKTHKMRKTLQNTYFNERFGRSDFSPIDITNPAAKPFVFRYLMKYLEKSDTRVIYSKNTPMYVYSDIMDDDVVCIMGDKEKGEKLVLFDDFGLWDEGCYMGQVSPEVIAQMRKANS